MDLAAVERPAVIVEVLRDFRSIRHRVISRPADDESRAEGHHPPITTPPGAAGIHTHPASRL
jgi:hypothetical protein